MRASLPQPRLGHFSDQAPTPRRERSERRGYLLLSVLLLVALILPACQRGPRNFENTNDQLRAENVELKEQVEQLHSELNEAKQQLERAQKAAQAELPKGVEPPRCAAIEIGRFSGGIDPNDDGTDEAVRLYLQTLDRQRRFVQVVGRLRATAVAIPPGEQAITLGRTELGPGELSERYRSGFAGTHYTIRLPVDAAKLPEGTGELTVRLALEDLQTGQTHETEQAVRFNAPNPDGDSSTPAKPGRGSSPQR